MASETNLPARLGGPAHSTLKRRRHKADAAKLKEARRLWPRIKAMMHVATTKEWEAYEAFSAIMKGDGQ